MISHVDSTKYATNYQEASKLRINKKRSPIAHHPSSYFEKAIKLLTKLLKESGKILQCAECSRLAQLDL